MKQYTITARPLSSLQKNPGDSYGATLTFQHRGPAEQVWIGIGIAYGKSASTAGILLIGLIAIIDSLGHHPPFCFAAKQVSLNADSELTTYTVDVDDTLPADMQSGKPLDVQKFISKTQPAAGQVAPDDFGVNNWDDDVITPPSTVFDWGSMMGLLLMVMMMGMMMPMLGGEKPEQEKAVPAAAAAAQKEMRQAAAPAPSQETRAKSVVVTIQE